MIYAHELYKLLGGCGADVVMATESGEVKYPRQFWDDQIATDVTIEAKIRTSEYTGEPVLQLELKIYCGERASQMKGA